MSDIVERLIQRDWIPVHESEVSIALCPLIEAAADEIVSLRAENADLKGELEEANNVLRKVGDELEDVSYQGQYEAGIKALKAENATLREALRNHAKEAAKMVSAEPVAWQQIEKVADEIPDIDGNTPGYLCLLSVDRTPDCGYPYMVANGAWLNLRGKDYGVTHWMPLPAAPQPTKEK